MRLRVVRALRVFPSDVVGLIEGCTHTNNLVSMDSEKTQQVCFQKIDGRRQTCSRFASVSDVQLTFFTLTERARAQGQPS